MWGFLTFSCFMGFPGGSDSKESACQGRKPVFDPWIRKIPWRSEWLPTPVFLPGECYGQRSLVGYIPRGCKESDTTEWITLSCCFSPPSFWHHYVDNFSSTTSTTLRSTSWVSSIAFRSDACYPELTRSPWVEGSLHKTGPTTDGTGTSGPWSPTTPLCLARTAHGARIWLRVKAFRNDQVKALSGSLGPIKVHGTQWCYPETASVHSLPNFMS